MRDGKKCQLQAGGDAGLIKNVRQVALHGFFAQGELLGDVPIAATFNDATHHIEFARSQAVGLAFRLGRLTHELVERGNEIHDTLAANPVIPGKHGADGGMQMAGERVLEHDATGANMERLDDLLGRDRGSEEENLDCGRSAHDGAHGLESGQARHLDIKQQDVGRQLKRLRDGFVAVVGFANHRETVALVEHVAYADAHYRMIICQNYANWVFHVGGLPPKAVRAQTATIAANANSTSDPESLFKHDEIRAHLSRKFCFQHTLQFSNGGVQLQYCRRTVIQLVTLVLKNCAEMGGLQGASHAAAPLDSMPNASYLV